MKYIFSLFLVFSFNFSFSQMTLSEMMRVYNMDMDRFELYAIGKGYELFEYKNDSRNDGVRYKKGEDKNLKLIGLYSNFFELGVAVSYQTSNTSEYIGIKNELKKYNFKLTKSDSYEEYGTLNKLDKYRNNIYEFFVSIIPANKELIRNYVTYQLSIYKY